MWPAPSWLRWLQVALEAPAAALMLWLAVRWGLVQSLKIRLLAMLHGGFLWLGIALALQAVSHSLMALSQDQQSLGAGTHACNDHGLPGRDLAGHGNPRGQWTQRAATGSRQHRVGALLGAANVGAARLCRAVAGFWQLGTRGHGGGVAAGGAVHARCLRR